MPDPSIADLVRKTADALLAHRESEILYNAAGKRVLEFQEALSSAHDQLVKAMEAAGLEHIAVPDGNAVIVASRSGYRPCAVRIALTP